MRRRPALPLLLTVLAFGAASCGGDDEDGGREPRPQEPATATRTAPLGAPAQTSGGAKPGTTVAPAPDTAPAGTSTAEAAPRPRKRATTGPGGGAQAPSGSRSPATERTGTDAPPPTDSPAGRFERFCDQNPGACD